MPDPILVASMLYPKDTLHADYCAVFTIMIAATVIQNFNSDSIQSRSQPFYSS